MPAHSGHGKEKGCCSLPSFPPHSLLRWGVKLVPDVFSHNLFTTGEKVRRAIQQNNTGERNVEFPTMWKRQSWIQSHCSHPWCFMYFNNLLSIFLDPFFYCHSPLRDNVDSKWGSKSCVSFMFLADVWGGGCPKIHILHPCGLNIKDQPTNPLDPLNVTNVTKSTTFTQGKKSYYK